MSGGEKELMNIASVMCHITRERGATEAAILDHDMKPLCKEWGVLQKYSKIIPIALVLFFKYHSTSPWQEGTAPGETIPRQFRYLVSMRARVNAFKPKELSADENLHELRSSQLGAVIKDFNAVPKSEYFGTIWEVRCSIKANMSIQ